MDQQVLNITQAIGKTEDVDEINDLLNMFLKDVHSLFSFEQIFTDSKVNAFIESSLKSVLQTCAGKIRQYKGIISQYEDELKVSREKNAIIRFENELCQNKIHDLTSQVNQLKGYLSEADTKVNLLHSDILYLIEENKLLADSLESLRERSERAGEKNEDFALNEDNELKIANYRAEINRLHHDVADQSILLEKFQKNLNAACSHSKELERYKQEVTQTIESLRAKKRRLKRENCFLKEELKSGVTLGINKKQESDEGEKENKNNLTKTRASIVPTSEEASEIRDRKFSLISDVMNSTIDAKLTTPKYTKHESTRIEGSGRSLEDESLNPNYLKIFQSRSEDSIGSENDGFAKKRMSYTDLFMKENILVKWDEGDFPRLNSLNSRGWSSTSIKELSLRKIESYKNMRDGMVLPSQRKLHIGSSTQINEPISKEDILLNEQENQESSNLKDRTKEAGKLSSEQVEDVKRGVVCKKENTQTGMIMPFITMIIIMIFSPLLITNSVFHKLRKRIA